MRSIFYIDGFNLYHSIDNFNIPALKWLNLYKLAEKLRIRFDEQIMAVYYFSAYADWRSQDAQQRHRVYVKALQHYGIHIVLGKFKVKNAKCPACGHKWDKHEEKESDVNLALQIVSDAYEDKFDRAYIISADSDMIPAMRMVREKFPQKEIIIVFPPNARGTNDRERKIYKKVRMKQTDLQQCLFPVEIRDNQGQLIARRPRLWR